MKRKAVIVLTIQLEKEIEFEGESPDEEIKKLKPIVTEPFGDDWVVHAGSVVYTILTDDTGGGR